MLKKNTLAKGLQPADFETTVERLQGNLEKWAAKNKVVDALELFTFGEMKSLVEQLLRRTGQASLPEAVGKVDETAFVSAVRDWLTKYIVLRESQGEKVEEISLRQAVKNWLRSNTATDNRTEYANYLQDKGASRLQ